MDQGAVFQCQKCRTIVGDSLSLIGSNGDDQTITLSSACNISVDDASTTSVCDRDAGCTFRFIRCEEASCKAILGKLYLTTTSLYDAYRDAFTFSTTSLVSYVFGSAPCRASIGTNASPTRKPFLPLVLASDSIKIQDIAANSEQIESMKLAITRVQQYLLVVDERLDTLESLPTNTSFNSVNIPASSDIKKSPTTLKKKKL